MVASFAIPTSAGTVRIRSRNRNQIPTPIRPKRTATPKPPVRPECDRTVGNNAQKLDWIAAHKADAAKVAAELEVSVADILGLSALESGWGTGRFARQGNNFFSEHYPASLAISFLTAND